MKYLLVLCSVVLFGCSEKAVDSRSGIPQETPDESYLYKSHSAISENIGKVYTVSLNSEASEGRGEFIYFEGYTANTYENKSRGFSINGTAYDTGSIENFPIFDSFENIVQTGELNFDSISTYDEAIAEKFLVNNCLQSEELRDRINSRHLDCYSEKWAITSTETDYFDLLDEVYKDGNTFLVELTIDEYHLNSTRGKFTVSILVEVDNFRRHLQEFDTHMVNLRYKVLKISPTTIIE